MFILISFIFFNTSDQFHQSSPGDTHRIQGHTGRQQASCVRNIFFLFSFPSIFLFYLILMNKNSDPGLLIVIHRKRTHKMNRGRERGGGREREIVKHWLTKLWEVEGHPWSLCKTVARENRWHVLTSPQLRKQRFAFQSTSEGQKSRLVILKRTISQLIPQADGGSV